MPLQPNPEIENLKPSPHGGIDYAELKSMGLTGDMVIDFSVCSNPFMPSPEVKKSLNDIAIEQYPDSEATEFRQQLSKKLGVSPDKIQAGSGTIELIRLIALTYFRQGDSVLILEPTFGEYELACQIAGAKPVKQWGNEENNFVPKIGETVDLIRQHCPKGVFICNPSNPTGKYMSRKDVERILSTSEDTLFIIDEAYISFVDNSWSAINLIAQGNVLVLRSMTKDYALAGLRLGYAIADRKIINNLHRVRPPWNVNIMAQKAGVAALKDTEHLEQSWKKVKEAKQFLVDELCRLGFQPLPSDTNFFLMRVGDAGEFRTTLLKRGILVRDCTSFGLPEYVRIAPRTISECQKFLTTLQELNLKGA